MKFCTTAISIIIILLCSSSWAADQVVFVREDFRDLKSWEPLYFPKIKKHTTYSTITDGGRTYLKAQSQASASAIIFKKTFNPYQYPRLRWRWRTDNIYRKWNGKEKSGDDYPIRIYVMFPYDPKQASLSERMIYGTMKAVYGKYPPHSTMNYVWASSGNADDVIISPYTDKARMVVVERGSARIGQWVDKEVNIINDYRRAFGKAPPAKATIAVMNDSDNTGESAVSYVEYIEIRK